MSLINDALRRAREAQTNQPPPVPEPISVTPPPLQPKSPPRPPPLDPVEPPPMSPWSSLLPVILVGLVVFALAGTGGYFFWKSWTAKRAEVKARLAAKDPPPRPIVTNSPVTKAATSAQSQATNPPPISSASTPATVAKPLPTPTPVPAPSAASNSAPVVTKWPNLRLQGIFYRTKDPCVVINNRTLFVDDMIEGAKVVAIHQRGTTLVLNGQTNFMVLR